MSRLVGIAILLSSSLALATSTPAPSAPPPGAAEETYRWQLGPKPLDLGHDVQLQLPAGYVFLGMPDADRFLKKNGSFDNEGVLGVVMSQDQNQSWGIILDYQEAGYVKDDEKLDADALLKAIREGTEEGNKERIAHGFPALSVGDWSESPRYDHVTHRLVWALPATSTNGTTINYNTRVLGRRGFVSLNLLSGADRIATEKANAATLLAATTFKSGSRYEDFDKKHDKVAEYGLMGLILGGAGIAAAAGKVGILAKLGGLLLAAKKLIIGFFVLVVAGFKKLFGIKTGKPEAQKETKLPPTGTDGTTQPPRSASPQSHLESKCIARLLAPVAGGCRYARYRRRRGAASRDSATSAAPMEEHAAKRRLRRIPTPGARVSMSARALAPN